MPSIFDILGKKTPFLQAPVILLIVAGYFLYNYGYNRGSGAARAKAEKAISQITKANEIAVEQASKVLAEKIQTMKIENRKLEDAIVDLNREAEKDPDANRCGLSANSVRRLNSIK